MKKSFRSMLVLAVSLFVSSSLMAKGIFLPPGAKANNMGAAFVAVANDPTAIYWNPAGLAYVESKSVEVSALYLKANASADQAPTSAASPNMYAGNFPLPSAYPNEPQFTNKNFETSATVPFVAGVTKTSCDMAIAIGYYGAGGGGGKWSDAPTDGVATLSASLDALITYTVMNVSFAKELSPGLAVGLGVDMIAMTEKETLNRDYTSLTVATNYGIETDKNSTGSGIQIVGGILYAIKENLKTGLVVRSGTDIKLSGDADYTSTGVVGTAIFTTPYEQTYNYPLTYGIGLAYDPKDNITIGVAMEHSNYAAMKQKITYTMPLPAAGFSDADADMNWKDMTQYRVGAQYRANENWSLYLGAQNEPPAFDQTNLTLFNINQYDLIALNLGAGYTKDSWVCNFSYAYIVSDQPKAAGITYEYPLGIFRLDIGYRFL
ncbi:OmpP1/FadL family transporter [Elusimicrobiota bacterium]